MTAVVDSTLTWTEHYVKYGFAHVSGLVSRSFCEDGVARVRQLLKTDLPLNQWEYGPFPRLYTPYFEGGNEPDEVFGRVFEEPLLCEAIEEMFGGHGHWDRMKNYYLFFTPFNPNAKQSLSPQGHIDFPGQCVPILYRGFTFQVLMADNEKYGGNLTLYPGTHKIVQKTIIDQPLIHFNNGMMDLPSPAPVEFVGKAGDVCFMHHLIFHSGNENAANHRTPRIALHAEAFRQEWLRTIEPSKPGLSPWERSLALNGPVVTTPEVEIENMRKRQEYIAGLRK